MKAANTLLGNTGTTIFTVMSALATRHEAINLGQGFPDTDGPADVVAAAAAALQDGRNQYPPLTGVPELRAAVAAANSRFYGLTIDPNTEVVVTSGATEAITASLMALIDPGDEVVLIEPLYDTYLPVVTMLGGIGRLVRLEPPNWTLPRAALEAAFGPRTKAIVLNSPMNPIGKVFTPSELGFIADLMQKHDTYAVCDEVYEHLVFDGVRHQPLMTLPGMRERTLRIGSADLQAKRDHLVAGLQAAGFRTLPSGGSYFVLADYSALDPDGDDAAFCMRLVEAAGVAAIPLSAFYVAEKPRHHVRFAFCKRINVLDEAVSRLTGYFGAHQASGRAALTAAE